MEMHHGEHRIGSTSRGPTGRPRFLTGTLHGQTLTERGAALRTHII